MPWPQSLDGRDLHTLFKAAADLVVTNTRKNARPRRNRAILYALVLTGLRVSELVNMKLEQYQAHYFLDVRCKGRRRRRIFVPAEARKHIDDYLKTERPQDTAGAGALYLFCKSSTDRTGPGKLSRIEIQLVLKKLAAEASKFRKAEDKITVHPHQLRHNYAYMIRKLTGSDAITAARLGHTNTRYIARYAQEPDADLEALLDGLKPGELVT